MLSVTYLITLLQQSLAFVMGDNATEIDLDSVIDRLLEGAFLFLRSRNIFYGHGSRRFSISPIYCVHVGSALPAVVPLSCSTAFQVSGYLRGSVGYTLVGGTTNPAVSSYFLKTNLSQ